MQHDYAELMQLWDRGERGLPGMPDETVQPPDPPALPALERKREVADDLEASVKHLCECAHTRLQAELLARIHSMPYQFFENLTIALLRLIGVGSSSHALGHHTGKPGDRGIDGVIMQDELGLESIFVQAKRLRPGHAVPISDVRDFAGSLDAHHAAKGVFVTTGQFSLSAKSFVSALSRKVVLVDGLKLTTMMIRHNFGVATTRTFHIRKLDETYFSAGVNINP
jgi:restriction system protein